jgi:hypothetical protein
MANYHTTACPKYSSGIKNTCSSRHENEKREKKRVGRALQVRGQVVSDRAAAAHPKELAICPFLSPIRQRIGWVRGQRCGELVGVNKRMVGQQVVQEGSAVEKKGDKW